MERTTARIVSSLRTASFNDLMTMTPTPSPLPIPFARLSKLEHTLSRDSVPGTDDSGARITLLPAAMPWIDQTMSRCTVWRTYHICITTPNRLASQFNRHQTAGTSCIHRSTRAVEVEERADSIRQHIPRHTRSERRGLRQGIFGLQHHIVQRRGTDKHRCLRAGRRLQRQTRVLECMIRRLENQPLLRIYDLCLCRTDTKERCIETTHVLAQKVATTHGETV